MFNFKAASIAIEFAAAAFSSVSAQASSGLVGPHSSRYFSYDAHDGEIFSASLSGDGDTNLDLFIYKVGSPTICRSVSAGDNEVCRIRSYGGGHYTIEVRNLGVVTNKFQVGFE